MVVLVSMGDAKVQTNPVQEVGLGQHHATVPEIPLYVENQPVGTGAKAGVVIQQPVRIAAILVQDKTLDQCGRVAVCGVQRHGHARSGASMHGFESLTTRAPCIETGI